MIGSHNCYTYLKSTNIFINLFKIFWRCQDKTIDEQYYDKQVRYFDIRIRKKHFLFNKNKFKWQIAHGNAKFNVIFNSITDLFKYMSKHYPLAIYRIVLEHCSDIEVKQFKKEIEPYIINDGRELKNYEYKCAWLGIKKPWTKLYKNDKLQPNIIDYSCKIFNIKPELSLWQNIKLFKINQIIKPWAKKNNPILTKEQIKDNNICYFMDYV